MSDETDIVVRLDRAADDVPVELSALLLEAADTIRMLRELVTARDETWLERTKPEGRRCLHGSLSGQHLKPFLRFTGGIPAQVQQGLRTGDKRFTKAFKGGVSPHDPTRHFNYSKWYVS